MDIERAIKFSIKDLIPIDKIVAVIQQNIQNNFQFVIKIYNKLHIILSNYDEAKDLILPLIWEKYEIPHKGENMLRFLCDSIWKDYITDLSEFLMYYNFRDDILLNILLIKFPDKIDRFIDMLYEDAYPGTIIKYIKLTKNYESLINFKNLCPYVFKILKISPSRSECIKMIQIFPNKIENILEIYKGEYDIDILHTFLEYYLSLNYREFIISDRFTDGMYSDIYAHCLDDVYKVKGYTRKSSNIFFFGESNFSSEICKFSGILINEILTKILSHKIIPNDDTYTYILKVYGDKNIDSIRILIDNGFVIEKRHIIAALKHKIYINKIVDIKLDEDDYFYLFLNGIDIREENVDLFPPEMHKRIQLREIFRQHNFSNAIKFMKKNNLRPDRYCLDASFGASGNSKISLFKLLNEYKCMPLSCINYLQQLKPSSYEFRNEDIAEFCIKNNINKEYMMTLY